MFTTSKISGSDAINILTSRRAAYRNTGEYPFLVGDAQDLVRIQEAAGYNRQKFDDIICAALKIDVIKWFADRRTEAEEYEFSAREMLGTWPGEVAEKGEISFHRDLLSGRIKSEVVLGIASIQEPWQLPAVLKYGGWNSCPEAEIHCAIHRKWQLEFGAQITGISGDVIECAVSHPPVDQTTAIQLAWQQYWYCADIVDQGCDSISYLAATLLNAPYWYFWWD
jgi:hypothetical protein